MVLVISFGTGCSSCNTHGVAIKILSLYHVQPHYLALRYIYNSICKSYIVLQERDNRGRMLKQRSCGEQAGWRGTGRPNLTRETKASRGASRERESYILPVQPTTSRIDNHTRVVLNILKGMATLTHTHTHIQWIELFGQLFCWRPDDPLAPQWIISDHNQNFNVTMPSTRFLSTT